MTRRSEHEQVGELLPWFVNGTLADAEHAAVEQHVRDCIPCRVALKEQQRLAELIKAQPMVHLSADSGFEQLMQRVEAPPRLFGRVFSGAPAWRIAASAALAVVLVTALLGYISRPDSLPFSTLSQGEAGVSSQVDLIFVTGVTETEMRELLREIGGTIIAGPSAMGRYTIRVNAGERDGIIAELKEDDRVRFAGRSFEVEAAP